MFICLTFKIAKYIFKIYFSNIFICDLIISELYLIKRLANKPDMNVLFVIYLLMLILFTCDSLQNDEIRVKCHCFFVIIILQELDFEYTIVLPCLPAIIAKL